MSGAILWFTGLPSSGKSTLAQAVARQLAGSGDVEILDGDDVRRHLSKDLSFSKADREKNMHRVALVARLLARHDVFVIVATISPYAGARDEIRRLASDERIPFVMVSLDASLESLVARDVKGLYRRALAGEIEHFTGVSDPYERPENPDIVVKTDEMSIEESVARILTTLVERGLVPSSL